jgi:alpha-ketoglutarate-dependent taurine dioxygenase
MDVRFSALSAAAAFPIVIQPTTSQLSAVDWARGHRDLIEAALLRHGAILFRDFELSTSHDFEAFAEAMSPGLYGQYGELPKQEEGHNIYRSTPYPQQKMILFHNESSHLASWPRKQWFFCELPASRGGATPLADIREVALRLPAGLADTFERKALLYIRTFVAGLDVPWRHFFGTSRRAEVEAQCRATGTQLTWLDEDTLQTRTSCQAIIRHPATGERVFFNQVLLHHPSSLDPLERQDLVELLGADRLPRNVLYGDGTPIEDEVMASIGNLYEDCAVRFPWQRGDVVMLDNMRIAHARDPFEGARRISVAMADMFSRGQLPAQGTQRTRHVI